MRNKIIVSIGELSYGGSIVIKVFKYLGYKVFSFKSIFSIKALKFIIKQKDKDIVTIRSYPILLFFKETIYFQNLNVLYHPNFVSNVQRLFIRTFRFNKLYLCQSIEVKKKLSEKFPFLEIKVDNFAKKYFHYLKSNDLDISKIKLYDCCIITSNVKHRRNELVYGILREKKMRKFLQIGGKKINSKQIDTTFFLKLSHRDTIKELSKSKSLIITSEYETIFLPLIEAIFLNVKIIFFGQDFVKTALNEFEYNNYEIINLR